LNTQNYKLDSTKIKLIISILAISALLAVRAHASDVSPLRVVATIGMVADAVREVGGDRVSITQLIGSGIDPHLYKPTRSDVTHLLAAQAIFYCGTKLEGKMAATLERMARAGREVQGVIEAVAASDPNYVIDEDPHVWMDVQRWIRVVDVIASTLSRMDTAHAASYHARATQYAERLRALDDYVRRVIASIPPDARLLITAHDAFNYFGRAYGIEVFGIQGISTESEAGLERINRLVDLLVERRVPAIFVETSVPDRNVRALIEGARSRGHDVRIGGTLFSDAMGKPGTYEGTYIGMIDHNATVIARALGGVAPERGLHGLLSEAP
jgi:manganese/zinc/iron transport system substrate-binding protein